VRIEPEAEDAAAMWQWICDLHAGRVDDATEEMRQAAQQAGFTIDSFAPVLAEAARLERFLDGRGEKGTPMTRLEMEAWAKDIANAWGSSPENLARAKAAARAHLNLTIPDDAMEMMTATLIVAALEDSPR